MVSFPFDRADACDCLTQKQLAAAILDQHPEESAIHLQRADLRPRGRGALCHRSDFYGLLHNC